MEINPPSGYGSIVPLEKHHKALLPNLPAADGARMQLQPGWMFRIGEARFVALKAASHKALAEKGWAARVYARLFSPANCAPASARAGRGGGRSPD